MMPTSKKDCISTERNTNKTTTIFVEWRIMVRAQGRSRRHCGEHCGGANNQPCARRRDEGMSAFLRRLVPERFAKGFGELAKTNNQALHKMASLTNETT